MSRFDGGWICLYRKLMDSDIYREPHLLKLWMTLLLTANVYESSISWRGKRRIIYPGQVVTGLDDLSKMVKKPKTTIKRYLDKLHQTDRIRQDIGNRGRVITICKWEHYQHPEGKDGKQTEIKWNSSGKPVESQWNLIEQRTKNKGTSFKNVAGGSAPQPTPRAPQQQESLIPEVKKPAAPTKPKPKVPASRGAWEAYSEAFLNRHGTEPLRNATVNGQMANFVKRVGQDNAPEVARFYLSHRHAYYVQNKHPVWAMLKDAEKLYAEWKTGDHTTGMQARQVERASHFTDQMRRAREGKL